MKRLTLDQKVAVEFFANNPSVALIAMQRWLAAPQEPQAAAAPQAAADPVGVAHAMPGAPAFTMACFTAGKVPAGTILYAKATGSEE